MFTSRRKDNKTGRSPAEAGTAGSAPLSSPLLSWPPGPSVLPGVHPRERPWHYGWRERAVVLPHGLPSPSDRGLPPCLSSGGEELGERSPKSWVRGATLLAQAGETQPGGWRPWGMSSRGLGPKIRNQEEGACRARPRPQPLVPTSLPNRRYRCCCCCDITAFLSTSIEGHTGRRVGPEPGANSPQYHGAIFGILKVQCHLERENSVSWWQISQSLKRLFG